MSRELIIRHLGSDWARMSDYIRRALNSDVPLLNSVNDTVLSHSGKMLRPMVTLLLARACGTPGEDTFRYAAALVKNGFYLIIDGAAGFYQKVLVRQRSYYGLNELYLIAHSVYKKEYSVC